MVDKSFTVKYILECFVMDQTGKILSEHLETLQHPSTTNYI